MLNKNMLSSLTNNKIMLPSHTIHHSVSRAPSDTVQAELFVLLGAKANTHTLPPSTLTSIDILYTERGWGGFSILEHCVIELKDACVVSQLLNS